MVEGERLNVTFVNFLWVRSVLAGIEMNSYNYLQTLPGLDWSLTWGLRRTSICTFHFDSKNRYSAGQNSQSFIYSAGQENTAEQFYSFPGRQNEIASFYVSFKQVDKTR